MKKLATTTFILCSMLFYSLSGQSQSISGVINDYTPVTAIDVCEITVESNAAFSVGDKVMIIQMKGADIDTTDTPTFGMIDSYDDCGNYEWNRVAATLGGTVVVLEFQLERTYTIPGLVQLIRVPEYTNASIDADLTCLPWDGSIGGVLAFIDFGTTTLNANINTDYLGFRANTIQPAGWASCAASYKEADGTIEAKKGEGIYELPLTMTRGLGANGNGGGGGRTDNGGGGASNFGAGGLGGNLGWTGLCNVEAMGGWALTYDNVTNKIFMGGAGGDAQNSEGANTNYGENGGGIIIIRSNEIVGNGNTITSQGEDAFDTGQDGGGGGGAGGTVLLDCPTYTTPLNVNTSGGDGGDAIIYTIIQCSGGGGGGGGALWVSTPVVDASIAYTSTGGVGGLSMSSVDGSPGDPGGTITDLIIPEGTLPPGPDVTWTDPGPQCETFDLTTLEVIDLNGLPGTDTAFYSVPPDSATQIVGLLPDMTMEPGDVVYVMLASGNCFDFELVTIDFDFLVNAGPDYGESNCAGIGVLDINAMLTGADPGGTWTETTTPPGGGLDAAAGTYDITGLPLGDYTIEYVVDGGACPNDTAVITLNVGTGANAGDDSTVTVCNLAGSSIDLNTLLSTGAELGGAWTETSASGAFTAGTGTLNTDGLAAGVYTFVYDVPGTFPCPADQADFTVIVEQEVTAGSDNVLDSCNFAGATVDLTTLLSGADPGGTWAETTASGSFAGSTFTVGGLAGGVYTFTYTVDGIAPCPSDVATFDVTVNEVPTLDPLTDEEVCDNENLVSQTFTADAAGTMFDWTNTTGTDIGFGLNGTGTSVGSFTGTSGSGADVTVTVEVTPYTAQCQGSPATFNITVHPLPSPVIVPDITEGCEPLTVVFNDGGTGAASCSWEFGDGSTGTTCFGVNHTYNQDGVYTVTLTTTTAFGCSFTVTEPSLITVTPFPEAYFTFAPQSITVENTEVEFFNSSINASSYSWDFDDESPTSTETDPTHTFPDVPGQYLVTLTAGNESMTCVDQHQQLIIIEDVIIFYVPNVFTPDGDEYNEVFKPVITAGIDVYDYHLTVFNRYGEVIFESFNKDFGWDGSYGDRGLVQDGTYVWQIEFGDTNSDKKHKHRGHVTILK